MIICVTQFCRFLQLIKKAFSIATPQCVAVSEVLFYYTTAKGGYLFEILKQGHWSGNFTYDKRKIKLSLFCPGESCMFSPIDL